MLTKLTLVSALVLNPAIATAKDKPNKQVRKLLAMTPQDFAKKVLLDDDDLEITATLDTSKGFQYKSGIFGQKRADVFLRAFVDKTDGTTLYQVYFTVKYDARDWAYLERANYTGPDGLRTTDITQIGSDVGCSAYTCTYLETVGFQVSEAQIEWLAGRYKPNTDNPMKIRFKTRIGVDVNTSVMPAEAGGLLARVEEYRAKMAIPTE